MLDWPFKWHTFIEECHDSNLLFDDCSIDTCPAVLCRTFQSIDLSHRTIAEPGMKSTTFCMFGPNLVTG
jgi:hypothetical protein